MKDKAPKPEKKEELEKNEVEEDDVGVGEKIDVAPLREIVQFKRMPLAEERALLLKAKTGDEAALEKIIQSNIRFIRSLAFVFQKRQRDLYPESTPISREDFEQAGIIGLINAVDVIDLTYDKHKGSGYFLNYAGVAIKDEMRSLVHDHGPVVRIPSQAHKAKDPNARIGIIRSKNQVSIDEFLAPNDNDEENQLPSTERWQRRGYELTDENETEIEKMMLRLEIEHLMARSALTPQEEDVIRLRYLTGKDEEQTLVEVGNVMGLSRERIRQIESRALHALRWAAENAAKNTLTSEEQQKIRSNVFLNALKNGRFHSVPELRARAKEMWGSRGEYWDKSEQAQFEALVAYRRIDPELKIFSESQRKLLNMILNFRFENFYNRHPIYYSYHIGHLRDLGTEDEVQALYDEACERLAEEIGVPSPVGGR